MVIFIDKIFRNFMLDADNMVIEGVGGGVKAEIL